MKGSLAIINTETGVDCITIESGPDENASRGVDWQPLNHKLLPTVFSVAKSSCDQVLGSPPWSIGGSRAEQLGEKWELFKRSV